MAETDTGGDLPAATAARLPALTPEQRLGLPARDPAALARFFDLYFERVHGYVRRLVPDEHLAEDLTQDVFLQIYRALPGYDPERELSPWVFTIATNRIRDLWRSRAHQEGRAEVDLDAEGHGEDGLERLPEGVRPDETLAQGELLEHLRRAVDGLPEGLRMTVLLRAYEQLSFEEIGRILGRNEVAVRKRYSRALEILRASLGPGRKPGAGSPA
jgi:RNA polymerase sigma-70 factor (ECF subfamily)